MKHCVAILAHKAVPQLKWLVELLLEQDALVMVHADAKSRSEIHKVLLEHENIIIDKSIDVRRAHYSLIEASLALMRSSLVHTYDYFHLISGDDLPLRPLRSLSAFLAENEYNYINYNSFPLKDSEIKNTDLFPSSKIRRDHIPISNYMHYSMKYGPGLYESYQFTANPFVKWISKRFGKYRTFWKVYHTVLKRKVPKRQFFIGSAWFSVQKKMIEHFVNTTEQDHHFYTYFKHVAYPDEIYFHTLALNSPWKNTVINSDLRYINWDRLVNGGPSILNSELIDEMRESNGFFARKWEVVSKVEFDKVITKLHAG